jgi:hypothetical protein
VERNWNKEDRRKEKEGEGEKVVVTKERLTGCEDMMIKKRWGW